MRVNRNHDYDDSKMRNGGIDLSYKSLFEIPEKVKQNILLEVGFDQTTPNELIEIRSWAYDKTKSSGINVINNFAKVKCYYPEYTFVEKLQTISTKVRNQIETSKFGVNFLRHFYDVHMLLQEERIRKFIGTEKYFAHKEKRFRKQDELDLTKNMAFNLEKSKENFNNYESEYNRLRTLFIAEMPSFKDVYASILELKEMDG